MRQDRIWPVPNASIPVTLSLPPRPGIKSFAPRMGYPCWRCQCQHKTPEESNLCRNWHTELGRPQGEGFK